MKCCRAIFPWEEVRVWSRSQKRLDEFMEEVAPFVVGQPYEISPSLTSSKPCEAQTLS